MENHAQNPTPIVKTCACVRALSPKHGNFPPPQALPIYYLPGRKKSTKRNRQVLDLPRYLGRRRTLSLLP